MNISISIFSMESPKNRILPPNLLETDEVIINFNDKVFIPDSLKNWFQVKTITLHEIPYPIATAFIDRRNRKGIYEKPKHVRSDKKFHKTVQLIKENNPEKHLYFEQLYLEQFYYNATGRNPKNPLFEGNSIITKILQLAAWNQPTITLSCTFYELVKVLNKMPKYLQDHIQYAAKNNLCSFKKGKIRHLAQNACCDLDKYINYLCCLINAEQNGNKNRKNI
jgi:hypothetical protein